MGRLGAFQCSAAPAESPYQQHVERNTHCALIARKFANSTADQVHGMLTAWDRPLGIIPLPQGGPSPGLLSRVSAAWGRLRRRAAGNS